MPESVQVTHDFEPVFDERSRILMLGTMPSPKSREVGFYYGHPRNRFWKVMADVCQASFPQTKEEKIAFALSHRIAVWDVLSGCEICGADDSSIKNPVPNDMSRILERADIQAVFATGTKAGALYRKYCQQETKLPVTILPSTSPANCRISYEQLYEAYRGILPYLRT
ncbi:DNA-deoxyinosine glycosylase [Ruminococcus sp. OA3]|uniref:DNA-deoxyinosine glycosylase n=1 Tax=Ruminococcus sp. OA3 TaxID=2914164 RepID=UPI001F051DFC|nr:DNA-deoxyinosine glycosylase [Ruminococcus sp. OA3]MCH1981134.1 DNA-deoxyinosine glycosylase [Ruminococcus sp. OA3]